MTLTVVQDLLQNLAFVFFVCFNFSRSMVFRARTLRAATKTRGAMSAPASPIGVYRGVLPTSKEIACGTKSQLEKLFKTVDPDGFQPTTVPALREALIEYLLKHRTVSEPSLLERGAKTVSSLTLPTATRKFPPTTTTVHVSPQHTPRRRVPDTNSLIRIHERNLRQHERRLEKLERRIKQQNLILYNFKEGDEEKLALGGWEEILADRPKRLGQRHTSSSKARPLRLTFVSVSAKHKFLKAKQELTAGGVEFNGIRVDDDLTRLQQQERQSLSDDFSSLKNKGHKPFFRGSELKYYFANKMHTCQKGKANMASSAV